MTFPVSGTATESKLAAANTTFTINFEQNTGDRVVIAIILPPSPGAQALATISDSFVDVTAHNELLHIIEKVLDGSEGGSVTVTFASSTKACAIAQNYDAGTFDPLASVELSVIATGTEGTDGTTPDSDNLSPSWGALDTGWGSCFQQNGEQVDNDAWATAPTDFTNLSSTTSDTGGASTSNCQGAMALRDLNTAALNPSNFTSLQDRSWKAFTFGIKPLVAAVAVPKPSMVSD